LKTGLFLSRHDGAISETVDVDLLSGLYSNLPVAKVYDSFFRHKAQTDILKTVDAHGLDSVVFAGNSPKYYDMILGGTLLLDALKSRGINENKIAFANIHEQVAMSHKGERVKATEKAGLLIDVALTKVEMSPNIKSIVVSPRRSVLIVGTTAGGIIAAWELLAKGYRVFLAERGLSLRVPADMEENIMPTLAAVQSSDRSKMFTQTEIKDVSGYAGQYKIVLTTPGGDEEILVGGIILSLGNDIAWVKALRSKMRFGIDPDGSVAQETMFIGQTTDPGIWFLPSGKEGITSLADEISGASRAVLSLTSLLDANEIAHSLLISAVDEKVCGGCGTCVKTCAFAASSIDLSRKLSVINPERCKGCGNCVTSCPTGARDLVSFPTKYISKAISLLSRGVVNGAEPKILAILCKNCGYSAADSAGELISRTPGQKLSLNVMPFLLECGGNVDTQYVLEAFSNGFDGVALFICRDGHCHNIVGNTDMQRRLGLFRAVLRSRDIKDERLRVVPLNCHEGQVMIEELQSMSEDLKTLRASN